MFDTWLDQARKAERQAAAIRETLESAIEAQTQLSGLQTLIGSARGELADLQTRTEKGRETLARLESDCGVSAERLAEAGETYRQTVERAEQEHSARLTRQADEYQALHVRSEAEYQKAIDRQTQGVAEAVQDAARKKADLTAEIDRLTLRRDQVQGELDAIFAKHQT